MKPILYALNTSAANENLAQEVADRIPGPYVEIDPVFETGFDALISEAYKLLGLETYFTTGADETRAWTIKSRRCCSYCGNCLFILISKTSLFVLKLSGGRIFLMLDHMPKLVLTESSVSKERNTSSKTGM